MDNLWQILTVNPLSIDIFGTKFVHDTDQLIPASQDDVLLTPCTPTTCQAIHIHDCLHELHGGDIGITASTSVHEDMPEFQEI